MTIKEDVFQFIEKNPEMSLDQVVDGLPHLKRTSVRKYFYDYRKLKDGGESAGKPSGKRRRTVKTVKRKSIRLQVYDLLDDNPKASIDEICAVVAGCNRKTIRDYRNRWRSMNRDAASPGGDGPEELENSFLKEAVYHFMRQNPGANLNDLKKRFPEYKKLVTDFRSWKLEQSNKLKSAEEAISSHLSVDSYKKTIDSLKQVIEKQKVTIENQRSKLKLIRKQLAQVPKLNLDSLKSFIANRLLKK